MARRTRRKFTTSAKITCAAVSVMGFIGSWNLIGRWENQPLEAEAAQLNPTPVTAPPVAPTVTPWPTIAPLAELPPVPTLIPTRTTWEQLSEDSSTEAPGQVKPLPTLVAPVPAFAPLPTLAPLPEMPTPLPPPPTPQPAPEWSNQSGGS